MNDKLPSREQALKLLYESRCSPEVIGHCRAVAKLATETAQTLKAKGINVDAEIVEIGAILHDIGRSKTHSVHHAIVGAKIAESAGLPNSVVSIIKRHVGGGITSSEAEKLGWPRGAVYVPLTLEEKIVSYADKLIAKSKQVPIEVTIKELSRDLKPEAVERVRKLHEEINALLGDHP